MIPEALKSRCEAILTSHSGKNVTIGGAGFVGGGCINETAKLETSNGLYFVKWNNADRYKGMFEAEAKGLMLLRKAACIRLPEVIDTGIAGNHSFILMEFIEQRPAIAGFWEDFGHSLAALHRHTASQYGLDHDNFIGSLPQSNKPHDNWTDFFVAERLEPQIKRAMDDGNINRSHRKSFEALFAKLDSLIPMEPPSLLHGDLWSGNFIRDDRGRVCLLDPAVYYGHRQAEIAFTRLFGGYDEDFYRVYQEAWPLQPGFDDRIDIFNLYPLMVHVNLFGGGYLSSVERCLRRYR